MPAIVGATRFELAASRSRTVRSTKLSHAPNTKSIIIHPGEKGKYFFKFNIHVIF